MKLSAFKRRGVVEGFFGPPWTMAERRALFEFGAGRGMNSYLYAPKDDPYHRKLWRKPYPKDEWRKLLRLIRDAQKNRIDFVYGFHPGEGLCFSEAQAISILFQKARRFYDAGVKTFAVLFDDISSRLVHGADRRNFNNSLATAEGSWLERIVAAQPSAWKNVQWWICPSYYTEDPLLERVYGRFEPAFLETLARHLPEGIPCFWTGPSVVSKTITLAHARRIAKTVQHPLLLWDNYPVNDLSMRDELHIGPLDGRDPRLPEIVYGYFNNPLLQAELSLIPLATCFDYAAAPRRYNAEQSWARVVRQHFSADALPHWRAIRAFCDAYLKTKKQQQPLRLETKHRSALAAALEFIQERRTQKWAKEIKPWSKAMRRALV
jgi:hyaluronoglucosaminidase